MTDSTSDPGARAAGWYRLEFPRRDAMTKAQREIYDASIDRFGGPYGPRMPLMFAPGLYEPWAALGAQLHRGALPARLRELAILATVRHWEADFAWLAHEPIARSTGLGAAVLAAVREGAELPDPAADEQAVLDFTRDLLAEHQVSDEVYAAALAAVGSEQLVELTVLIGHYSSVSLSLAAHAAPMPAGRPSGRPEPAETTRMPLTEHVVENEGASLYVRIDGPDDAPALLLSNSMGTPLSMWEAQMSAFAEQYCVIRYDIRGHGRSTATEPPYDLALLSRDALAVLDALGVEQAHFCGVSIGGMVGETLAIEHADRVDRVVVANTGLFIPPDAMGSRVQAARELGLSGLVDTIVPRWFTQGFIDSNPDVVVSLKKDFVANSFDGYLGCCYALGTLDNRATITSVSVPMLVIGGEHDPAATPEQSRELAEQVPGAELVVLDCAHLSNVELPDEFTAAVLGFLGKSA